MLVAIREVCWLRGLIHSRTGRVNPDYAKQVQLGKVALHITNRGATVKVEACIAALQVLLRL